MYAFTFVSIDSIIFCNKSINTLKLNLRVFITHKKWAQGFKIAIMNDFVPSTRQTEVRRTYIL